MHVRACMSACACVHACACMCVCVCAHACACVHVHACVCVFRYKSHGCLCIHMWRYMVYVGVLWCACYACVSRCVQVCDGSVHVVFLTPIKLMRLHATFSSLEDFLCSFAFSPPSQGTPEAVEEVGAMLVEKLPVFIQSGDLEVQERACCILQVSDVLHPQPLSLKGEA